MDEQSKKDDMAFGATIRTRRTRLGMTLGQLSEATGISVPVLSRVERGHHSPTLHNAIAIARQLGCELTDLLEHQPTEIIRAKDALRFLDRETGIEHIALARPGPAMELLRYHIPPGASSRHFPAHNPGSHEVFHILSGTLTLHTAQKPIQLETGDTATIPADTEHWFENNGRDAAQFILMIAAS